jgi:4-aminobutyrate aminotransferase
MALKLARIATGRHKTVSMWDSFHGASLDAISVGGEALFRRGVGPLLPGTEHVPPCDPRSCHFGCNGSCNARCAEYVEYVLAKEEDVAAVVVETVRSTDVQAPPRAYYETLRRACDRHGALLILDEIPICLGRTGTMFAFERYGIVPDMVVLGKGLGGGIFPMAALVARAGLDLAADRALGHYTHEKSSVGCAAALATIEVIESEGLLERANRLGAWALQRLREMQSRLPAIVEVRGVGLLLAIELADAGIAEEAMYRCLSHGLSFKIGQGNVIVLAPPLVIEEADLERALKIVEEAIDAPGVRVPTRAKP